MVAPRISPLNPRARTVLGEDAVEVTRPAVPLQGVAHRAGRHPDQRLPRGVDDVGRLLVTTAEGVETFAVGDVVHASLGR